MTSTAWIGVCWCVRACTFVGGRGLKFCKTTEQTGVTGTYSLEPKLRKQSVNVEYNCDKCASLSVLCKAYTVQESLYFIFLKSLEHQRKNRMHFV